MKVVRKGEKLIVQYFTRRQEKITQQWKITHLLLTKMNYLHQICINAKGIDAIKHKHLRQTCI